MGHLFAVTTKSLALESFLSARKKHIKKQCPQEWHREAQALLSQADPDVWLSCQERNSPVHHGRNSGTLILKTKATGQERTLKKNFFFFTFIYFWEKRESEHKFREGQREKETQNPKQALGSEPSAQSLMQGLNSQTVKSGPELKSDS